MLNVKTPDEALEIIRTSFVPLDRPPENVTSSSMSNGGFRLSEPAKI